MGFSRQIIIYNVPGGFAPATVASPGMISMEIRGNLNILYSCKNGVFNRADFSARSRAVFKIMYPAGNCPENGHGLLGLMEIPALGIYTVIFL